MIIFFLIFTLMTSTSFAQETEANLEKEESASVVEGQIKLQKGDLLDDPDFKLSELKSSNTGETSLEELIEQPTPLVEFIVDSSGSMGQLMTAKKTKIYILKKILGRYLTSQWTYKSSSGLRVFGSKREKDCTDNYLAITPGESKLGHIEAIVKGLEPVGKTPIGSALLDGYKDIKDYKGPKRIILFTDGEETCGKDPCKIVDQIKKSDIDLKFFVVAFGLKDQSETIQKLSCIGGMSMADSEEELEKLFQELDKQLNPNKNLLVQSPDPKATVFLYKSDNTVEMFRKFEAQLGIEVPPGDYIAVVNLKPKFVFQKFTIPPKRKITLKVKGDAHFRANFIEGLIKIELRNKENKIIQTFKSDQDVKIPSGKWNLKYIRVPFYEKTVEDFLVIPNAEYNVDIDDAGVGFIKDPDVKGFYVYNNKGEVLGNYLTNFPFVLKKGVYEIKVDKNCTFRDVNIDSKKEINRMKCGDKK